MIALRNDMTFGTENGGFTMSRMTIIHVRHLTTISDEHSIGIVSATDTFLHVVPAFAPSVSLLISMR